MVPLKYINKYILTVFICFFAVMNSYSQEVVLDKIIAKVNEQIILKSELETGYIQASQTDFSSEADLKCKVLESIVINKLLLAQAEIDSVIVADELIDDQLDRRMQYFVMQIGSQEKLEAYFKKSIDEIKRELRKDISDQMVVQQMQEKIVGNIKITPKEVNEFFEKIPKDSLPYFSSEVEVGIIVKFPKISKNVKEQTIEKLKEIRQQIVDGTPFEEMAKKYSQDGSAQNGGDLGFFGKGELVPEYEAAALILKPGQISMPVESQFGFHIIELLERRGNEYNTRHILIKPNSEELDNQESVRFLDSLRSEILKDSISFEKAAKKYSEDKFSSSNGGFLTNQETRSRFLSLEDLDTKIYFTIDTMKVGTISKPIEFKTEEGEVGYRLIYYKSKKDPHQANFNDDYQKLSEAALNYKKQVKLENWFDKAKTNVYLYVDDAYKQCKILE